MLLPALSYRLLSTHPGVYIFKDKNGKRIYVGKAINLKSRVSSYFTNKNLGEKTKILVSQIDKIEALEVTSELEAFLLEEKLIKKYKPRYNIKLIDGKSYPLIKITLNETYPRIFITRKEVNDGSLYFGPYSNASSLKSVLKIIRRIFPYQSANHQGKICLYNHLGLCPCASITKDKSYKNTMKYIIDFLNGNTKKIIKDLEKERESLSKKENFESAEEIQKKIESIILVTSPFYKPFEYEQNPNLRSDVISYQLSSLKNDLNDSGVNVTSLERIECYDISNISGKYATGSMVVFTRGEKNGDSYRRFKIKRFYKNKANDFAMLEEMLERRFKNDNWPNPSLIIVDGGKGQITSVKKILSKLNLNFPLIGLAKKEETIITEDFREVRLPKNSRSLLLIMHIRDEAHRFAIAYHKKLRSKFIFE